MMMPSGGYQASGSLPYADEAASSINLNMPLVPVSFNSGGIVEGFENNFIPNMQYQYTSEGSPQYNRSPRNRKSPSKPKVRTAKLKPETDLVSPKLERNNVEGEMMALSDIPMSIIQVGELPPIIAPERKHTVPKSRAQGRGRGRGRGMVQPDTAKLGKGRAGIQGVVIPISHQGREDALAQQALKRRRVDEDEPQDDTEDRILQTFSTRDPGEKTSPQKKKKPEGKGSKRDHHACDRCFRNKTKVGFRQLDGS
jgi:hypothetical protein